MENEMQYLTIESCENRIKELYCGIEFYNQEIDRYNHTIGEYIAKIKVLEAKRKELIDNKENEKILKGENEVTDVLAKLEMFKEDNSKNVVMTYMTVTDFISQHSELRTLNAVQVGKVLEKLGYPKIKKKIDGKVVRVRELPKFIGCANYPEY